MAKRYRYAFTKKKEAQKGKLSTCLAAASLLLFVIAVVGYLVPVFNILAVLVPFLFPRIAVALRPLFMKKR